MGEGEIKMSKRVFFLGLIFLIFISQCFILLFTVYVHHPRNGKPSHSVMHVQKNHDNANGTVTNNALERRMMDKEGVREMPRCSSRLT